MTQSFNPPAVFHEAHPHQDRRGARGRHSRLRRFCVGSRRFAAYPDRPIKIVVANTPGGPSDIIARIMAAAMQDAIGGSVIVENKGGAGGNIGMGLVARSEPDGYTILLSTSAYLGQSRALQHAALRPVQGLRRRSASLRSRRTCSR